jgi:hypothetical protein
MAYNYRFNVQIEEKEEEKIKDINFSESIEHLKEIQKKSDLIELKKLCEEIIEFYEEKQKMLDENIPIENEKSKLLFQIHQKTERLLIESIYMENKENKRMKIIRIYNWYLDQVKKFNELKKISERTEKEWYQEDEIIPQKEEPPKIVEINKHRSNIFGYESAKKRMKEYNRKSINANDKYKYVSFQDEDLNLYGKDFGYNTMTNFKPINAITSPNKSSVSQNSTKYGTFYNKGKVRAEINTGSDWFSKTGLDYNREVKESYSYIRPPYEYEFLYLENKILEQKHKELSSKRNEEEINNAIIEFGFKKSFFNGAKNEKNEMKTLVEKYKELLNLKRIEEEKRKKEEEIKKKMEEEILRKEIQKQKEIAMSKMKQIKKTNPNRKKTRNEINEPNKEEDEKKQLEAEKEEKIKEEIIEQEKDVIVKESSKKLDKKNLKINIDNIKYINPYLTEKDCNDQNPFIKKEEAKNVTFYEIKSKDACEKLKEISMNNQYNNFKKLQLDIEENNSKENKKITMPSPLTSKLLFSDKIFLRRHLSRQLNGFKEFDMIKNRYQGNINPLSYYDDKYTEFRNSTSRNEKKGSTESFALKTYYNYNNNFLKIRKTLSAHNEKIFRDNKLFKKSKPKFRIILGEMNFLPKDKKKFNYYFLPNKVENQLLAAYKIDDKKGKKSKKK